MNAGRVLYQERKLTHWAWHLLMAAAAAGSATATLSTAAWTTPFPLALCFALWATFAIVRVAVTTEEVVAHCGMFGPTIAVEAIESAEVVADDRSVRIRYRVGDAQVIALIRSRDPERVVRAIAQAGGLGKTTVRGCLPAFEGDGPDSESL